MNNLFEEILGAVTVDLCTSALDECHGKMTPSRTYTIFCHPENIAWTISFVNRECISAKPFAPGFNVAIDTRLSNRFAWYITNGSQRYGSNSCG